MCQNQIQGMTQPERIDIVQHIHGGGAQVNDRAADGTLFGKGFDLRHQIMANLALNFFGAGNVDLLLVGAQIGDLCRRYQAGFGLRFGQGDPKAAE